MTRVVLDTHALIWLVEGDRHLGSEARDLADSASSLGFLMVSAMSFWEIAMLVTKGRLELYEPVLVWREAALARGILEIPINGHVAVISNFLDGLPSDPWDRIIAASALDLDATLVTADRQLLRWDGDLARHDARI